MKTTKHIKISELYWKAYYELKENTYYVRTMLFRKYIYLNDETALKNYNNSKAVNYSKYTPVQHALERLSKPAMETRMRRAKTYDIIPISEEDYKEIYKQTFIANL